MGGKFVRSLIHVPTSGWNASAEPSSLLDLSRVSLLATTVPIQTTLPAELTGHRTLGQQNETAPFPKENQSQNKLPFERKREVVTTEFNQATQPAAKHPKRTLSEVNDGATTSANDADKDLNNSSTTASSPLFKRARGRIVYMNPEEI